MNKGIYFAILCIMALACSHIFAGQQTDRALLRACWNGNLDSVKTLVLNKADVNCTDADDLTPLHYAAYQGHFGIVQYLIEQDADVNAKAVAQLTPLHLAAQEGYQNIVELLMKMGAKRDITTQQGHNALTLAIGNGKIDATHFLLTAERKTDIEHIAEIKDFQGNNILHMAVTKQNLVIVKDILQDFPHIYINDPNNAKETPIFVASASGDTDIVAELISHGANSRYTDLSNNSPLHIALLSKKTSAAWMLIKHGTYIDGRNALGNTPLMLATQIGDIELVKELLRRGASINDTLLDRAALKGNYDIFCAVSDAKPDLLQKSKTVLLNAVCSGNFRIVKKCLESNVAMTGEGDNDAVFLVYDKLLDSAALRGNYDIFCAVSDARPDLLQKSKTVLLNAVCSGNPRIVRKCLEAKVAMGGEGDNDAALLVYAAVSVNNCEIVELLVNRGAPMRVIGESGRTLMHLAALNGNDTIAKLLLTKGAIVDTPDEAGFTPLHYAAIAGSKEVASLLLENNANVNAMNEHKESWLGGYLKGLLEASSSSLFSLGSNVSMKGLNDWMSDRLKEVNVTPLLLACHGHHPGMVEFLLSHRADINAKSSTNDTPLFAAFQDNQVQIFKILLEHDPDLSLKDRDGKTIFDQVIERGNIESLRQLCAALRRQTGNLPVLLEKGIPILHCSLLVGDSLLSENLIDNHADLNKVYLLTPLQFAIINGNMTMVKRLISQGADVKKKGIKGYTSLHVAAAAWNAELFNYILETMPKFVNEENEDGQTPVMLAVAMGNIEATKLLIANGVDLKKVDDHRNTVLHYAMLQDSTELIRYLIDEQKMNPYAADRDMLTPLHLTGLIWNVELKKILTQNVAAFSKNSISISMFRYDIIPFSKVNSPDKNGWTPLHWAHSNGQKNAIDFLEQAGANQASLTTTEVEIADNSLIPANQSPVQLDGWRQIFPAASKSQDIPNLCGIQLGLWRK